MNRARIFTICQKLTVCKLGRCCPSRIHENILAVFGAVSFHPYRRTVTVLKLRVERILRVQIHVVKHLSVNGFPMAVSPNRLLIRGYCKHKKEQKTDPIVKSVKAFVQKRNVNTLEFPLFEICVKVI